MKLGLLKNNMIQLSVRSLDRYSSNPENKLCVKELPIRAGENASDTSKHRTQAQMITTFSEAVFS
jgi:hypothetical protein